ncbi:rhamnose transport system substrate-binding protein [Alkalicoccus daliensis]|uniref:Rhamnose transport system substrate-binding protein n=1 Tax=Alkalicoccus daliensis TaxID=745820 RepID=A0A1H0E824_9BACI|nr:autoinducer 2 ABC transporter substrate-binding protein [Alkalicoccus daliensis]SDN78544.1 rhamnose transport system substrate-binding protein [Alkalicoccus daliensis]
MKLGMLFVFTGMLAGCSNFTSAEENYEILYTHNTVEKEQEVNSSEDQYTIALVSKVDNISYFNAVEDGAREAAEDLDIELIFRGPATADSEGQVEIIEELITQEVDLIAVSANDPAELSAVLLEAQAQGIEVISWDSDVSPGSRSFFINMVDSETLGRHLMDTLAWNVDESGDFAVMIGTLEAPNINKWLYWMEYQQKIFYPDLNLVEVAVTDDDPQKAYKSAQELIENHEDLIGIVGASSVGPPAAAQAVAEAGKSGDISVVGLSTPDLMNSYLKEGAAQMVTLWSPKKLGYLTVSLSKQLLEGNKPYDGQEIERVGRIKWNGDTVIMGDPIDFTDENVDYYDF